MLNPRRLRLQLSAVLSPAPASSRRSRRLAGRALLAGAALTLALAGGAQAATPGPVGAWAFDEGFGTATSDASGLGNGGTIANASWTSSGKHGRALTFNGSSSLVSVADSPSLDVTTAVSIDAWVRPTALGGMWRTIALKERTANEAYGLYANNDQTRPDGLVYTDHEAAVAGTSALALNTWTHVATTWDGTTQKLYINGALVASKALSGTAYLSGDPLRIGGNKIWNEWFKGQIDDVRVYDRALSASEVQYDMKTAVTTSTPGAIASGTTTTSGGTTMTPTTTTTTSTTPTTTTTATTTTTTTTTSTPTTTTTTSTPTTTTTTTTSTTPTTTTTTPTDPGSTGPCTTTVSSVSALQTAAKSAANGSVVCVAGGSYGAVTLSGLRTDYVTLRPADGASVTLDSINIGPSASHYNIRGFVITNSIYLPDDGATDLIMHGLSVMSITLGAGANNIVIDHNYIHQGGAGIMFSSSDCTVSGAPTWSGCQPETPISNVTINGNKFQGPFGEDAMQLKNFRNVTVTDNEITEVREDGSHNDCLQTVYGGSNLVFKGNYEHDNRCQGIFVKDGAVTNVDVENNFFVKNDRPCLNKTCSDGAPMTAWFGGVSGLVFRNNVMWNNQGGFDLEAGNTGVQLDHNVMQSFYVYSTSAYSSKSALNEDYNVFKDPRNWGSYLGAHTVVNTAPSFVDPASYDYRLSGQVSAGGATYTAGVTWKPTDKHFGP